MEQWSKPFPTEFIKAEKEDSTICSEDNQEETKENFTQVNIKEEFDFQATSNSKMYNNPLSTNNDEVEMTDIVKCIIKEEEYDEDIEQAEEIEMQPDIIEDMYDYTNSEDNKPIIEKSNVNYSRFFETGSTSSTCISSTFISGQQINEDSDCGDTNTHLYSVKKGKENACVACGLNFRHPSRLTHHIKVVHNKVRNYHCDICDKLFAQMYNLRAHITAVHAKVKSYSCKECDKIYSHQSDVNRHVKAVHRKVKNECEVCHKTFSQISSLKLHISLVHKGIFKHYCEKCNKNYARAFDLNAHISAFHENIKKFECKQCFMKFSHTGGLNKHIKVIHKKIYKYTCDDCQRLFRDKHVLKRHITGIHTDTYKYDKCECKHCGRKYSHPTTLKRHIKVKHQGIKS